MTEPVTDEALDEMVALLGLADATAFRARVRRAHALGWTHLGLWPGEDCPPDETDLFGVSPDDGLGYFVPPEL